MYRKYKPHAVNLNSMRIAIYIRTPHITSQVGALAYIITSHDADATRPHTGRDTR